MSGNCCAGSVIAYAEANLGGGVVRPFAMFLYGSGDGNPADNKLHGFMTLGHRDITAMTDTTWFSHLAQSQVFARDYACPGRAQGLGVAANTPGVAVANPGAPGLA